MSAADFKKDYKQATDTKSSDSKSNVASGLTPEEQKQLAIYRAIHDFLEKKEKTMLNRVKEIEEQRKKAVTEKKIELFNKSVREFNSRIAKVGSKNFYEKYMSMLVIIHELPREIEKLKVLLRQKLDEIKKGMIDYPTHVKNQFEKYYDESKLDSKTYPKDGSLSQLDNLLKNLQTNSKNNSKIIFELRKHMIFKMLDKVLSDKTKDPYELLKNFNDALDEKDFYKKDCPTLHATFLKEATPKSEIASTRPASVRSFLTGGFLEKRGTVKPSKGKLMLKSIEILHGSAMVLAAAIDQKTEVLQRRTNRK